MTRRILILTALALLLSSVAAHAAPLAARGEHDIGGLLEKAEELHDLSVVDAVYLLESRDVVIENGDRTSTTHRIVWIGTELGIELFADLRVPYNTANAELEVHTLRTWRDGVWWPHETEIAETAVVPTLPGALRRADDYTTMREMMLLHDGVELPCVVETVYSITERANPRAPGHDELWLFAQYDPAVRVEYRLTASTQRPVSFASGNGAPEPTVTTEGGSTVYACAMEPVARIGRPAVDDPVSMAPYVVWSTWRDWNEYSKMLGAAFDEAAALDAVVVDTIAALMKREPTGYARAHAAADYVAETVRPVAYDESHWRFEPRAAQRTWETAYGHRLDRAVFAAAVFREAMCRVRPVFLGTGYGPVETDVISLGRFSGIGLEVTADGIHAYYDPSTGSLEGYETAALGRAVWLPGQASGPTLPLGGFRTEGRIEVSMILEPGEEDAWGGTGFFLCAGSLSAYDRMAGLSGEAGSHLGAVAGGVLAGADVTDHSFLRFERGVTSGGFTFDWDPGEGDDEERMAIEIGEPAGGLVDALPGDVHIHEADRESPIEIVGPLHQAVTLRARLEDREIVYRPGNVAIENDWGAFALTAEEHGNWLSVTRELTFFSRVVPAEAWPDFRAILLGADDARGRRVLFR